MNSTRLVVGSKQSAKYCSLISSKLIKIWFTLKEPLLSTHEKSPTHKIDLLFFFLQQSIDKSELCLQKNWVTLTATSLFVILLYLTWWQSNFSILTLKRKLHKNLKYHSKKYRTKTWRPFFCFNAYFASQSINHYYTYIIFLRCTLSLRNSHSFCNDWIKLHRCKH